MRLRRLPPPKQRRGFLRKLEMDVTSQASVDAAFERIAPEALDVLVNNAGIGGATPLELRP